MERAMQGLLSAALSAASLTMLSVVFAPSGAATIQRCIGTHGEPLFAERCVTPVGPARTRPATVTVPAAAAALRAGDYCARTPALLANGVGAAVQARNGVRLSGFALWRGMSARVARGETRDLMRLLRAASVSVVLMQPPQSDADLADPSMPMLAMLRVSERAGITETEQWTFRIVRDHGCYWFDPQPERRHAASPAQPAMAADESAWGDAYTLRPAPQP